MGFRACLVGLRPILCTPTKSVRQPVSRRSYSTAGGKLEPLRILFCGSDEFSIHSLNALAALRPAAVESINVVCKTAKRTGRGLKKLTYPPIYDAARSLDLPIHPISTFTGWTPSKPSSGPIDLIVAVSFGLLVPPRILSSARYGGLNVHPSLLPDLHGPAPIHWALLNTDTHSGVTLQTLHPSHFDQGTIIDQTPYPGIQFTPAEVETSPNLSATIDTLGRAGAAMLASNIATGAFLTPHNPNTQSASKAITTRHAPKLSTHDSLLNPTWTKAQLLTRHAVLGPLWDDTTYAAIQDEGSPSMPEPSNSSASASPCRHSKKRIQYATWRDYTSQALSMQRSQADPKHRPEWVDIRSPCDSLEEDEHALRPLFLQLGGKWRLVFRTVDGGVVGPDKVKIEGERFRDVEEWSSVIVREILRARGN